MPNSNYNIDMHVNLCLEPGYKWTQSFLSSFSSQINRSVLCYSCGSLFPYRAPALTPAVFLGGMCCQGLLRLMTTNKCRTWGPLMSQREMAGAVWPSVRQANAFSRLYGPSVSRLSILIKRPAWNQRKCLCVCECPSGWTYGCLWSVKPYELT